MPFRIAFQPLSFDSTASHEPALINSRASAEPQSEDDHLWGYLEPLNPALTRIDFWKITPKYTIGRNQDNLITFSGLIISGVHCIIAWDGTTSAREGVYVTDLSSNGTYIDGRKIGRNRTSPLSHGSVIAFGTPTPRPEKEGLEDYRYTFRHVACSFRDGLHATYDVGQKLGSGSFGIVRMATHRETKVGYAVKMIAAAKASHRSSGNAPSASLLREVNIMQQLQHRNICKLIEAFFHGDGSVNLVLELVAGGNLLKYINDTQTGLEENAARDITYQICNALAYMHSRGVTHRDLKPENILLTPIQPPLVKVADFGLAKVVDSTTMLRTMCGTPNYLAPEILSEAPRGYDNLVDSWSVGIIVFSMLTNRGPFRERGSREMLRGHILKRRVQWSVLESRTTPLAHAARTFIERLLERDPRRRMTLTSALQHVWLRLHVPFHGHTNTPAPMVVQRPASNPATAERQIGPVRTTRRALIFHQAFKGPYDAPLSPSSQRNALIGAAQRVGRKKLRP